jgi:hypothetical protein
MFKKKLILEGIALKHVPASFQHVQSSPKFLQNSTCGFLPDAEVNYKRG